MERGGTEGLGLVNDSNSLLVMSFAVDCLVFLFLHAVQCSSTVSSNYSQLKLESNLQTSTYLFPLFNQAWQACRYIELLRKAIARCESDEARRLFIILLYYKNSTKERPNPGRWT